jgi:S-adenosylmethionine hydrolase
MAAGRIAPADLGPSREEIVPSWIEEPQVTPTRITGSVIAVDHFGNLITNIDAVHLEPFAEPVVRAGTHLFRIRRTYGEVNPGDYLALVNSFDVVEIARAEQSAAEGLGMGRGAPVEIEERPR